MPLTPEEQELFDVARAAMPDWYASDERANEFLGLAAKVAGAARTTVKEWLDRTKITEAPGATSTEPDWLDQHARDRGTYRQANETDASLRKRLRSPDVALTRAALLAATQEILTIAGVGGTPAMVELPRDQAFFRNVTANTGTGGTFTAVGGGVMRFTPTVKFAYSPYHQSTTATGEPPAVKTIPGHVVSYRLVLSGASAGGNNGTFAVTGVNGNAAQYTNGSGAGGADAGVTWTLQRLNVRGQVMDGHPHSYLSRGFRLGRSPAGAIVLMLPYIASATTRAAVRKAVQEMLRQKKAGGVTVYVEARAVP